MRDKSVKADKVSNAKVTREGEVGAALQGRLTRVLVKAGDQIRKNTPLFVIEAMKMESTVTSAQEGIIKAIVLSEGMLVEQDDCVIVIG
ncbi:biotin/lipoyl-containing protein [Dyadobacter bucti]|uniref:biotin/lipoyl-containing protein n=1 Tax=Dyadobacter bucti TaxID=2572203 RepID=UPI003F7094F3